MIGFFVFEKIVNVIGEMREKHHDDRFLINFNFVYKWSERCNHVDQDQARDFLSKWAYKLKQEE